jgi:uncharacterized membrane protein
VDEAFNYEVSRAPLKTIIETVRTFDVSPPLYYVFIHYWLCLGTSDFWARLPSVLFSVLSALLAALLALCMGGPRAAALTAAACSFSAFQIFLGRELRMYPLTGALGISATLVFIKACETGGRRWWTLYGALAACMFWTHYHTALFIAAHGIEALMRRSVFVPWLLGLAGAALTLIPWLPSFIHQATAVTGLGGIVATPADLCTAFANHGLGYTIPITNKGMVAVGAVFIITPALALLRLHKAGSPWVRLMALCLFAPPLLMAAISVLCGKIVFNARYLVGSSIVMWVVLCSGALVSPCNSGRSRLNASALLMAVLIGINFFSSYNLIAVPSFRIQEFPPIVRALEEKEKPGDVIVIQSRGAYWPFSHYYRGRAPCHVFRTEKAAQTILEVGKNHSRIWLVSASPQIDDPQGLVLRLLKERYRLSEGFEAPGSMPVRLLLFE